MKKLLIFAFILSSLFNVFAEKDITFMVFMNGDNDLESYAIYDLNEMEKVGSTDDVNVVVQFDRSEEHDVSQGDWTGTRRYFVTKDNDKNNYGPITSKLVEDLGEIDMGDWKEAVKFFEWSVENYPAKKYIYVFWNHGSGWLKQDTKNAVRGISYDEGSKNHIDSLGMKMALDSMANKINRKLNVLVFDACLMSMVEVAYQFEDSLKYMCSSEDSTPGNGLNYEILLNMLNKNSSSNSKKIALTVGDAFKEEYEGQHTWMYLTSVTYSVVGIDNINLLVEKINRLSENLIKDNDLTYFIDIFKEVQRYDGDIYVDLVHLCQLIAQKSTSAATIMAANDIIENINNNVLFNWWQNKKLANSNGLSIYFPERKKYKKHYKEINFSKHTKWDELLEKVMK